MFTCGLFFLRWTTHHFTITAPTVAYTCDGDRRSRSRPNNRRRTAVKDYRASIEKLRKDAADAALIRDMATDKAKFEMYDRLHQHLNGLADEVERAMNAPKPV